MKNKNQSESGGGNAPRMSSDYYETSLEYHKRMLREVTTERYELLAALKGVAGDSIAMRGFHEQFRAQIRAAIAKAEGRVQ